MKDKDKDAMSNAGWNINNPSENSIRNWNPEPPIISGTTSMNYYHPYFDTPPTANIAINNNRIKQYDGKYYLNDGDEFQIELTNNSSHKYLVKIKLNGKYISSSGLILDPHDHYFLGRYIDTNKKFKFKTFMVDDVDETKEQREQNGLVELEYYREVITVPFTVTYDNSPPFTYTSNVNDPSGNNIRLTNMCSQVETGRVDQGSKSKQEFIETTGNFDSFATNREYFQILPQSQKPPQQIKQIRQYCSECGLRIRKSSWKYCPQCGEKL